MEVNYLKDLLFIRRKYLREDAAVAEVVVPLLILKMNLKRVDNF